MIDERLEEILKSGVVWVVERMCSSDYTDLDLFQLHGYRTGECPYYQKPYHKKYPLEDGLCVKYGGDDVWCPKVVRPIEVCVFKIFKNNTIIPYYDDGVYGIPIENWYATKEEAEKALKSDDTAIL